MTRFLQSVLFASVASVLLALLPPASRILHADEVLGTCVSTAQASAVAYDGSVSGSSSGGINVGGYTAGNCTGLSQTNAIFQAGNACANAGIGAGLGHGVGYAVVTWTMMWFDGNGGVASVGPVQQQYDCGDTFS